MKKQFLLPVVALLLAGSPLLAQNSNIETAAINLNNRELEDAKKYIDLAAAHPETSNIPKMWYYRTRVYQEIVSDTAWDHLDDEAAQKAIVSLKNLFQTDLKKRYIEDVEGNIAFISNYVFNKAVEYWQKGQYSKALECYRLILDIYPYDKEGKLPLNNLADKTLFLNSAYLYAEWAQKDTAHAKEFMQAAKENLQKLVDVKFRDPYVYTQMQRIYLIEGDTAKALSYIQMGRTLNPSNKDLINSELFIYQTTGKTSELVTKLTDALEVDPEDTLLLLIRAQSYESMIKGPAKAGEPDYFKLAEEDYKRILELDPNNANANYNLGALYLRTTEPLVDRYMKLSSKQTAEMSKLEKEIGGIQAKALIYLEKALVYTPEDKSLLLVLQQLYARMNNEPKAMEMKRRRDAIKNQ
jgi:tetratricopeptide (TPR) repeat protein